MEELTGGFWEILSDTLDKCLLGNISAGKWLTKAGKKLQEQTIVFNAPTPLTNFEIEKYFENEKRFNCDFSINNLPSRIEDVVCSTNLDEYLKIKLIG